MADEKDADRYQDNLRGELDSASLYRTLAEVESDPNVAAVYRRLAAVEEAHAQFWQNRLRAIGRRAPLREPGLRVRLLQWLARRFGAAFVLPTVNTLEHFDSNSYDRQPEAVARGMPADERGHARVLRAILRSGQGLSGPVLAQLEGRHRGGGNALRAAVLGANDGLVSNLSLVMGVAGASAADQTILITGLAGLLAGACSMAMGEWLSVTSSRELYQAQIAAEAQELAASPEEEMTELALIYQAKGLSEAEAKALAKRLIADKSTALDTLAREELGIDPKELGGSAWAAAAASFGLFTVGAVFPVGPYLFLNGMPALIASLLASAVALIAIGAGTTLFTGRSAWFSAARQLAIGFAAAGITYGLGALLGTSLAG